MESMPVHFCIEKNIESIPTLESSKMRLFNVLQDDNTSIERVENILSSDPAMTAKIIKLANSPFYRHAPESLGIHQSLLTIGLDMVKCLALSMAVMETFGSKGRLAQQFWRHSYASALVALYLSMGTGEKECMFTGALLHDLGRMVLLSRIPDMYMPLFDADGNWPDISLEREMFMTDHTIVGEAVAKRWHFPAEIVDIIRNHHTPRNRAGALVFVISHVVHDLEMGVSPDVSDHAHLLAKFFGKRYNDLVNTIVQRYRVNAVLVENLF